MNHVIIDATRNGLMWIGLGALLLIAAACAFVGLRRVGRLLYVRLSPASIGVLAFAVIFTTCEAQKRSGGTGTTGILPVTTAANGHAVSTGGTPVVPVVVTAEEIAQGWRLESVVTNDAVSYVMPEGVSPTFNWHKRGTFGEWARLDLGDFAFPLGTNDGAVTSFSVFNDGRIRPTPCDAAREICAVGVSMLAMQGASRFWVTEGAAVAGRPPYRVKRLTWENFFLNADTNAPVNAQIELFQNGDFITRSNDVERIYRRVEPFDWDGDGLENTVDPDSFVAGEDAHGTNAEWYNTVCSNVLEAVAGGGTGTTGILPVGGDCVLSWREGINSNAYYFVDVVTERGPVPIYFTGDRESRLSNPVVVANAFETNRVPLLIGVNYAVTSTVPFTVSFPDEGFASVTANSVSNYAVQWPLEFSMSPDGTGGFYIDVIPYDPGGTCQWGGGTGGGGLRSLPLEPSQCEFSVNGNWLGFLCYGSDCGCHDCSINGTYAMENASFNLPTLFCACSSGEDDPVSGEPPEPPLTPSVDIAFSAPALIFEDRYEASPDSWVEKRSTTNVLAVSAYGGEHGGTLILTADELGCLEHRGGPVSLPSRVVLGPYQSYSATFRCEGAENGGFPWVWGIISGPDGSDSSYTQTSVVRVEIQHERGAPENESLNRHDYGIGEWMYIRQFPMSPGINVLATDAVVRGGSTQVIMWGVSNIEHSLSCSLYGVEYMPLVRVLKPTGIEGYDAQAYTNGLPPGVAGGLHLVQRYRALPLTVNFTRLRIEEVPCYDPIPPTGYFIYTSPDKFPRTHTRGAGAGEWFFVDPGNLVGASEGGRDKAGCKAALTRRMPDGTPTDDPSYGWLGGDLPWKVPFGWKHRDAPEVEPVGVFAEDTRQILSITESGDFSVRKLGHTATRLLNGTVTVDGHSDDGVLDN